MLNKDEKGFYGEKMSFLLCWISKFVFDIDTHCYCVGVVLLLSD